MNQSDKVTNSPKSFEVFPIILSKMKKDKRLTPADLTRLEDLFGDRVQKALELVASKGITKFTFTPSGVERWVVSGHEKDYLVIENSFCSCKDFLFTALLRREAPSCYHLLAREIADLTDGFEEVKVEDNLYSSYMENWLE